MQFEEIVNFIKEFRKTNKEDLVIYTGYTEKELKEEIEILKQFKDIFVKFGRYRQGLPKIFDNILKVELISNNQYAIKIS